MIKLLKRIIGIAALEERIRDLTALNIGQARELENYRKAGVQYTTIPVPPSDALVRHLSDLHASPLFSFYILSLENEIVAMFTDIKGDDIYRGGLRVLKRIRDDARNAFKQLRGADNAAV